MIVLFGLGIILVICALNAKNKKAKSKKIGTLLVNIVLVVFQILLIVFLTMLSPTYWDNPQEFNADAVDVIRILAFMEVFMSIVVGERNPKNKWVWLLLLITNIFTVYKVIVTYIIFE